MNKKGFTLIEVIISIVLVSVVLISLLATLVKLRETYSVIHENTDVLVYSSSITRVINNDFVNNNGIRYISCNAEGTMCDITLGNDDKRVLEIKREVKTTSKEVKTTDKKGTQTVTMEDIKTSLVYSDTTNVKDPVADQNKKKLLYIRTLELEKGTNETTKITTADGFNFTLIETDQKKYRKAGTVLVDLITTIKIKLDDGKSTELSKYDIVLYASGRYDESKLIGKRYSIALDYGDEATTSGTTSMDEVYGVAYYEIDSETAKENVIKNITSPTRDGYAFLGYYYKRESSVVEEMIIDTTGKIIADTRTFEENITKEPGALSRVYAKWHLCTNYPGYEVKNGKCVPRKYKVTLNPNGGHHNFTGSTPEYIATYQAWVGDVTIPRRGGYVFTGYKGPNGKIYHDGNGIGKSVYDIPDPATFTAQWQICPGGYYSPETENRCIICPIGTFSTGGAAECTPCSPGYYQGLTGQTSCNKCPVGQHQPDKGQPSCKACEKGTYQNELGQPNCKDCEVGKYQDQKGQTSCKNCPTGQYQPNKGKDSCIKCEVGKYQNLEGQTSCKDCPAGQYQPNEGKSDCIKCVQGSYSGTRATKCIACTGTTTSSTGQSSCNANCSNRDHVASWNTATWNTNNTVSNLCSIKSCDTDYEIKDGVCKLKAVYIMHYSGYFTVYDGGSVNTYANQWVNVVNKNWKVKFLSSGTLTVSLNRSNIDLFLVGGGGAGGCGDGQAHNSGGGGGYTNTIKNIGLGAGSYYFEIGGGGTSKTGGKCYAWDGSGGYGGTTTALGYSASGGAPGTTTTYRHHSGSSGYPYYREEHWTTVERGFGGNGGSGGGGAGGFNTGGHDVGNGGADGGNGSTGELNASYQVGAEYLKREGGKGCAETGWCGLNGGSCWNTREFCEGGNELYSGGGGSISCRPTDCDYDVYGSGGAGGGGNGGQSGTPNTGGGGGGTHYNETGHGGSGIVVIRDHR